MKGLSYLATLVGIFWFCTVNAQLDPLLITPGTRASSAGDFENSRYTIKKNTAPLPEPSPSPTPVEQEKILPKVTKYKKEEPVIPSPLTPVPLPETKKEAQEDLIPPQFDITKNILEIKTEGFYLYNESKSTYGYRQYFTNSQGVGFAANVWLQPSWGFESSYRTTVNGSTTGTTDNSTIKSPETWLTFALTGRRVLSNAFLAPMLTGKLGYSTYQKKMPTDTAQRAGLTSTGAFLQFEASLPSSQFYDWILGLEYKPFQTLTEQSNGTDLASGDSPTTNGLGFILGGRAKLDRKNQIYWNTKLYIEKTLYNGNSRQVDPASGTVTNTPVQNTFLFFIIGFVWGG